MRLSIIVVSFNTKTLTLQTLQSVLHSFSPKNKLKNETEIIVVDNHSTDGSYQALQKLVPKFPLPLILLRNRQNIGFAQANNQAITKAKGKVVMLLNSDTKVYPGAIERLYKTLTLAKNQQLGLLAAQLYNADGSLQTQGGAVPNLWTLSNHLFMLDDLPVVGKFFPSTQQQMQSSISSEKRVSLQGWVAATALCIKKEVFAEIGFFDENIFMYGEDVEFCLRARHHLWAVAIDPKAKVLHLQSASSNKEAALLGELKGYIFIWAKHMPFWQRPILKIIIRLGVIIRWWLFATIGRTKQARLYRSLLAKV